MADLHVEDAVNGTQSMGGAPSVGATGNSQTFSSGAAGVEGTAHHEEKERTAAKTDDDRDSTIQTTKSASPISGHAMTNGLDGASDDAHYNNNLSADAAVSDSDSRADSVDHSKTDSNRRERSNSTAKKPAPFKPVSFTKNFLAKSGAATAPPVKPSTEKATLSISGSSSPAPGGLRPRLVAKSGRDSRPPGTTVGLTVSGGPDAAAPPAPPKQFTDEELKQQYGIHMAARLQADEPGKESKWADIDDDEDDWAPETVQWMDGVKTIPAAKAGQDADPQGDLTSNAAHTNEQGEQWKDNQSASRSPTSTPSLGPGKTILRPGARLQTAQTKPGLVLKNVPDTTPSQNASTSVSSGKSPWAALPPVDKVSPITFNPPPGAQRSMQMQRSMPSDLTEPTDMESFTAREIAADDFDRSWRDSDRKDSQLFNSQSGRYEPVRAGRRTSFRNEGGMRPPSLLQRPSHQDQSRASQDVRNWAPHQQQQRRGSTYTSDSDRRPSTDFTATSPALIEAKLQSPADAAVPQPQPADSQSGFHGASADADARAVQRRLMLEKVEANRKRKQEEEAREEAAKKERIRLKLEALGPAPTKEPTANTADASLASPKSSAASVATGGSHSDNRRQSQPTPIHAGPVSPPHEPNAKASNKPQLPNPTEDSAVSKPALSSSDPLHSSQPHLTPPKSPGQPLSSGSHSVSDTGLSSLPQQSTSASSSDISRVHPLDRQQPAWNNGAASHTSTNWSGSSIAAHAPGPSNVWGPPSNDRQLGNGAFDSSLQSIPLPGLSHPPPRATLSSVSGPIAPPSSTSRPPADTSRFQNSASPSQPTMLATQPFERRNDPFSRMQPRSHDPARAAWHQLPEKLAREETEQRAQTLRYVDDVRKGLAPGFQPVYQETYRQTIAGEALGERHVVNVSKTTHAQQPNHSATDAAVTPPQALGGFPNGRSSRFFGPGADKGSSPASRNLIQNADDLLAPPPETSNHPAFTSGSSTGHPLVKLPTRAVVKLPPPAEAHTADEGQQDSVIMPAQFAPRGTFGGVQPIVKSSAWQNRFDMLFNRKPTTSGASGPTSPPQSAQVPHHPAAVRAQTHSAAITSNSKAPLEVMHYAGSTTVTLPPSPPNSPYTFTLPSHKIESKPTEDNLMDEREFGSSPTIKLAKEFPAEVLHPLPARPKFAGRVNHSETHAEFASSAEVVVMEADDATPKKAPLVRVMLDQNKKEVLKPLIKRNLKVNKPRPVKDKPRARKSSAGATTQASDKTDVPVTNSTTTTDGAGQAVSQSRRSSKWAKPPKGERRPRKSVEGEGPSADGKKPIGPLRKTSNETKGPRTKRDASFATTDVRQNTAGTNKA